MLLKQLAPQTTPSEMGVADYILGNPKDAASMGIAELAQASSSSTAAIIRLSKHLGFKGFSDFKFALIRDIYSNPDVVKTDILDEFEETSLSGAELVPRFISLAEHGLSLLASVLDDEAVDKAADLITKAKQIAIFGLGASSVVGMDFQYKLARLGKKAFISMDPDLQQVQACSLEPEDVTVIISYSGETEYLFKVAEEARRNGSQIIAITKVGKNSISKVADVNLQVPVSESEYRQGATLSRLNQLVVIDILYGAVLGRMGEDEKKMLRRSWDSVSGKKRK